MASVELELSDAHKTVVHSISDQVYNQIEVIDSHQKKFFNRYPLHPYSTSCASIADISISGTDCDIRSYGYDSDNLLNSGYAASVSDATRSIGSVVGFDNYDESEASTCYISSVEQLSVTQAIQDEKDTHTYASNAPDPSIQDLKGKRRKNRMHSRRDARKVTISSEFLDFLGWDSTGDEKINMTQFKSNDVEAHIHRPRTVSINGSVGKESESVEGVLTPWSKNFIPSIAVQDSVEDVSTMNDSRFGNENFPIAHVRIQSDEDSQTDNSTYNKLAGGKLGWLYMLIIIISILTLAILIIVVMTQRM